MKLLSATCAVLLALLAYNPTSAIAQTASGPRAQATADTLDALSSARKHRKHRQHVRVYRDYDDRWHRRSFYNELESNRSFGFVGDYPGGYAWRRTLGQTVCDLGYGRWDNCDSR